MPMNDPNNYNVLTYFWMLFIASWGGAVNYISRVKRGVVSKFSFLELMGELVISGFSGVLTFWLCEAMSVEPLFTAACVGIAGHAGGRTVYFLEQIMIKKLERIAKKLD